MDLSLFLGSSLIYNLHNNCFYNLLILCLISYFPSTHLISVQHSWYLMQASCHKQASAASFCILGCPEAKESHRSSTKRRPENLGKLGPQRHQSIKWDGSWWINCFLPYQRKTAEACPLWILRGSPTEMGTVFPQWSVMHALLSFPSSCLTFLDLSFSSWNYLPNNILETKSLFQTLFLGGTLRKIVTMEVAQESNSSGWDSDLDHLEAAGWKETICQ